MVLPSPPAFEPVWLAPADVRDWLRINDQDTSDDDLIAAMCAMAEPYVQRCRPEWHLVVTPVAAIRVDVLAGALGVASLAIHAWQEANPGGVDLVNGYGHIITLTTDPADDWGTLDPSLPVRFTASIDDVVDGGEAYIDGEPLSSGQAAAWIAQHRQIVMTFVAGAPPSLNVTARLVTYWPDAETYRGAVMYAAREHRRRNSPAGIETFGDVTSFVARFDPDIDRALQTGSWARPVIA